MQKTKKKPHAKTSPSRRSAIGADPLDAYFAPAPAEIRARRAATASRRGLSPAGDRPPTLRAPKPPKPQKVRATFHLPEELVQEATDAVLFMRQTAAPVFTLAALADYALTRELERLKRIHNKGRPFPKSGEKLRGGRPLRSRG
jgi:hypothetical protein